MGDIVVYPNLSAKDRAENLEALIEGWSQDWTDKLGKRSDGSMVWDANAGDIMLLVAELLSIRQQVEALKENGVHADAPRERSAIATAPDSAPRDGSARSRLDVLDSVMCNLPDALQLFGSQAGQLCIVKEDRQRIDSQTVQNLRDRFAAGTDEDWLLTVLIGTAEMLCRVRHDLVRGTPRPPAGEEWPRLTMIDAVPSLSSGLLIASASSSDSRSENGE